MDLLSLRLVGMVGARITVEDLLLTTVAHHEILVQTKVLTDASPELLPLNYQAIP